MILVPIEGDKLVSLRYSMSGDQTTTIRGLVRHCLGCSGQREIRFVISIILSRLLMTGESGLITTVKLD